MKRAAALALALFAPATARAVEPDDELAAMRRDLRALQQKVARLEEQERHREERVPADPLPDLAARILGTSAFSLGAYVQGQFEWHEDSEDQLDQGGEPLNRTRFGVRRGRVRLDAAWAWSALVLELDASTTAGPRVGVRRAEASLVWRGPWGPAPDDIAFLSGDGTPPLVQLSLGLGDIPFGFELTHSARDRAFMERSAGSRAFFPGEPDIGLRLSGGAKFFRYALAIQNGEPLGDDGASDEPNAAKDFIGRIGVDVPLGSFRVAGGVSALRGEGFHPGTSATKDDVQWTDVNENGGIDAGELVSSPGSAATPSESFDRWALGADLQLSFDTPLGKTLVYGEVTLAQNLDRGLFVADPVLTGTDLRELSGYGALVQELSPYVLVGLRVDAYEPNGDFFDPRGGELLPASQQIFTLSPLVGGAWPGRAKLLLQYDHVTDALTRDARGVPTDLANDRFTARLQVSL